MVPPRTPAPGLLPLILVAACFHPTGTDPTASSTSSGAASTTDSSSATTTPSTSSDPTAASTSTPGTTELDPTTGTSTDATAASATTTAPGTTSDASSTGDTTSQTSGQMTNCGDGIVVVGLEECDDANDITDDGCDQCERTSYRVFTTKDAYDATFGGLLEADLVCQGDADAAGLKGVFRAWLSTDDLSATARLSHANGAPYVRIDGSLIANNWDALIANGPLVPLDRDATNTPLPAGAACGTDRVWTGTENTGEPVTKQHCGDWNQDIGATGAIGSYTTSGVAPAWTHCSDVACITLARLYCFEQPLP